MMIMERPDSPCLGICALDEQDLCIGCRRTLEEIARWEDLEADAQWQVIALLRGRAGALPQS